VIVVSDTSPILSLARIDRLDLLESLYSQVLIPPTGEAEAIALAIERKADLLLVDERRGRHAARASGVRVTGLLGVIAQAKADRPTARRQAGHRRVDRCRTVLDRSSAV
jgi:predicted nucleic acid-binding protein